HAVLKCGEIARQLVPHDIGACGQKLPELDVGGTKPVNSHRKPLRPVAAARAAARNELRHTPAEARQAGELIPGKSRHHALAQENPARADKAEICADGTHVLSDLPAGM